MSNISVFVGEYQGANIRTTSDKRFSVYDVLVAFGAAKDPKNTTEVWKRICSHYPEVLTFCENFKFAGRGQRETPVADEEGIYQILMLCGGQKGHEFRSWASKIVRERREEESNPELAYTRGRERAIKIWKKQGKSDKEIAAQIKTIEMRCLLTDTLQSHGVSTSMEYALVTNAIYQSLFDGTAKDLKQQRGLAPKDRLRDSFSMVETMATGLAEALAAEDIEKNNHQGFISCRDASQKAATKVRNAIK